MINYSMRNKYIKSLLHKYSSGKYYSWYTVKRTNSIVYFIVRDKILTKYVATGTAISSAFVKLGRITEDNEEQVCIYAECEHNKFCMKGGHTYNHVNNAGIRKTTRSKQQRKVLKSARNNITLSCTRKVMLTFCNRRS